MTTDRRGFLRMMGLGAAAAVVGPAVMKVLASVPSADPGLPSYEVDNISRYFAVRGGDLSREIMRQLMMTNPFLTLIDGTPRPSKEWFEEQRQSKAEVAAWHRFLEEESERSIAASRQFGTFDPMKYDGEDGWLHVKDGIGGNLMKWYPKK